MFSSAIVSFLGGSAFRFLIGRLTDWLEKRQEHLQELERIREQEKIDQAASERQLAMLRLQHELGVEQIKVAGNIDLEKEAARAFTEAMKVANAPTGIKFIDAWNGGIRPAAASIAIALWFLKLLKAAFVLTEWDQNLVASILGYYFADRQLGKQKGR